MLAVDSFRFGDFHHDTYGDIQDFRSRRYLPEEATNINMRKYPSGYIARYEIAESDLLSFVERMWSEFGEASAIERDQLSNGQLVSKDLFERNFQSADWDLPETAKVYDSPLERDGGGASYYFDQEEMVVFQRTGFW